MTLRKARQMNEPPEYLHRRLNQLRLLATETTDPLAERLIRAMIAELEDRLKADSSQYECAVADGC
jgi:nitrate reductase assembly molybdenum cofactor insertion protein NarJ